MVSLVTILTFNQTANMKKLNNFIKVPNNEDGRQLVALLKKLTKECNSKYKLRLKGRKPINGYKCSFGTVKLGDAQELAVYLDDTSITGGYDSLNSVQMLQQISKERGL